jgi:hypothetical protein
LQAQRCEQYNAQDTATLATLQQQLARARAAAAAEAACALHSVDAALVKAGIVPPPAVSVHPPVAPLLPLQYTGTRGSAVVDSINSSTASSFEQLLEQQALAEQAQTAATAAAAAAVERELARMRSEELAAAAAREAERLERQRVAAASAENTAAGAAERLNLATAMATRLQSAARGWVGRKKARGMTINTIHC